MPSSLDRSRTARPFWGHALSHLPLAAACLLLLIALTPRQREASPPAGGMPQAVLPPAPKVQSAAAGIHGPRARAFGKPLTRHDILQQAADGAGEGLRVQPQGDGARITCSLQAMEGSLTAEGLAITSTRGGGGGGREEGCREGGVTVHIDGLERGGRVTPVERGRVEVVEGTARLLRPGLTEEVTTGAEGIRQDVVLTRRPAGTGGALELRLHLDGASIASVSPTQVRLSLDHGSRSLLWHGLKVTDAAARPLRASFRQEDAGLAIRIEEAGATYPIRIDPTFTDSNWYSMSGIPGAEGQIVYAAAWIGSKLYVGGMFSAAGGILASNIAVWDGSNWSALSTGTNDAVYCIAGRGSDVIVGGNFTSAGGISTRRLARWDGTKWSSIGGGVGDAVNAIMVSASGDDLWVGGYFNSAGTVPVPCHLLAKWDFLLNSWTGYVANDTATMVNAITAFNGDVYIGGDFTTINAVPASRVAKWDVTLAQWFGLGAGVDNNVQALAAFQGSLYAGGWFTYADGQHANHIARWDGGSWHAVGTDPNGSPGAGLTDSGDVYALEVVQNALLQDAWLFVGGQFDQADGQSANYIACWDGTAWSPLGSGVDYTVNALASSGTGQLYVGGDAISVAGGAPARLIALWDVASSSWSSLGNGFDNPIFAVAKTPEYLYAGGAFATAGDAWAPYIARWDGSSWSAVGDGLDDQVLCLVADAQGGLYAGGGFLNSGTVAANHVAYWDGTSWTPVGDGTSDTVRCLALDTTGVLYAGGDFSTAGSTTAPYVARWDGNSWSALGGGTDGPVMALAITGSQVFAGGSFVHADGNPANRVAQWNGSAWGPVGGGMDSDVLALLTAGGTLYAGGNFTHAGGNPAAFIAGWDGSSWSQLGSGAAAPVNALASAGGDLYAGGAFTSAGGVGANYLARWDGRTWFGLGSGLNKRALALVAAGSDLFVGGDFTVAGNQVSAHCARADIGAVWNHAPVLARTIGNPLASVTAGVINQGTPVASLIFGLAYDPDRDPLGIAVTAVSQGDGPGVWECSTDNGTTWSDLSTVSPVSARLLTDAGTSMVRFRPTAIWSGSASITYRAWDRTKWDGVAATVDASTGGNMLSFSALQATSTVQVLGIVVSLAAGTTSWTEKGGPVAIDPNAVVASAAPFTAATLSVSISGGRQDDRLAVNAALSGIAGVISDGHDGRALVISLASGSGAATAQAILRSLTYDNVGRNPAATPSTPENRTVSVSISDGAVASPSASHVVTVIPVNDPPDIQPLTIALVPGLTVTGQVVAADPEGSPLTYAVSTTRPASKGRATIDGNGLVTYQNTYLDGQDDRFEVIVSDGSLAAVGVVTVHFTRPDSAAGFTSLPPLCWRAGQAFSYTPTITGLGSGVTYRLVPAPQIARTRSALTAGTGANQYSFDGTTGTLTITSPTSPDGDYLRFGILAVDAAKQSAYQSILMKIDLAVSQ